MRRICSTRLSTALISVAVITGAGGSSAAIADPAATAKPPATSPNQSAPPNIVFILIDDLGWKDLGYTGSRLYETPAIDQLARDGMRFTNAHASHPRCGPSRYSIMTGRFPARGKVPGGPRDESAQPSFHTVAEALHDGGYATFMAGKWHLGKTPKGFDINIGGSSTGMTGSHFFPYSTAKNRLGPGLETGKPGEYLADRLTDETIKFIDQHEQARPDQPFMVYLSHYGVHTPFQGKPELVAKFQKKVAAMGGVRADGYLQKDGQTKKYQDSAVYAAMIASIDESVGRVRAELTKLGIADNTLVVFTSDNGGLSNRGAHSQREIATSNLPLRAGKGHNYEGGTAIPMIVYWPGHTKPGTSTSEFTVGVDHYASMLSAAGLPARSTLPIDGISYLPVLSGGKMPADRVSYWYSPLPRNAQTGDTASGAIRIGNWKYYLSYEPTVPSELFDLAKDPYEEHDLSRAKPAKAAKLKDELTRWLGSIDAVEPRTLAEGRLKRVARPKSQNAKNGSRESLEPENNDN